MNPALVSAILLVALAVAVVASAVRVVPAGSVALVMRFGRVSRVAGPGLVGASPGLDRVRLLDVQPRRIEPIPVAATTSDGVDVRVDLGAVWRLNDAGRSLLAVPDVATATADAVAHAARQVVGETDLRTLVEHRAAAHADVDRRATALTREWGATVLDVDVLDVEVRAGPELLRLLG